MKSSIEDVDVGVVEYNYKDENKKTIRKNLKVDFIINRGSNRYYILSALNVDTREKQVQETESLRRTGDSFKKVVIVRNNIVPRFDDDGILYIGVEDFLLDESDYSRAAEPPVRCGESHLSGLTEPPSLSIF